MKRSLNGNLLNKLQLLKKLSPAKKSVNPQVLLRKLLWSIRQVQVTTNIIDETPVAHIVERTSTTPQVVIPVVHPDQVLLPDQKIQKNPKLFVKLEITLRKVSETHSKANWRKMKMLKLMIPNWMTWSRSLSTRCTDTTAKMWVTSTKPSIGAWSSISRMRRTMDSSERSSMGTSHLKNWSQCQRRTWPTTN